MISQRFRDLALCGHLISSNIEHLFVRKVILVGTGFQVYIGYVALNIGDHDRIFTIIDELFSQHPVSEHGFMLNRSISQRHRLYELRTGCLQRQILEEIDECKG